MKKLILLAIMSIIVASTAFLHINDYQFQDGCKVLLDKIGSTYEGDCKKGLAHGKGIARGEDFYEGEFKKGYPHGNGIYSWKNGNVYLGEWSSGRQHGKGKLTLPLADKDSIVDGYWRNGTYIGETNLPPYSIQFSRNIDKYVFRKTGEGSSIRIRFTRMGANNADITNIVIGQATGSNREVGSQVVLEDIEFPAKCTLRYSTSLKMDITQRINAALNFTINEPGSWEITVSN